MPIELTSDDYAAMRVIFDQPPEVDWAKITEDCYRAGLSAGIERAAHRLETATFATHEFLTVRGCIARIRALLNP